MPRRWIDLNGLQVFETVARLGSLTRAAEALGSTQPAVSYRIRKLEGDLGTPLFLRGYRGMELTADGRMLRLAVEHGLGRIQDVLWVIESRRHVPTVAIACDFCFASYWLMPRLEDFRAREPAVDVHVVAGQREFDAEQADVDIAVVFGDPTEAEGPVERLTVECVAPVCSPSLMESAGPFQDVDSLLAETLLHSDGPSPQRWFTWESWCAAIERPFRPTGRQLHFNMYTLLIQAALAGQGIALGWLDMVESMLQSGQLIRAFDREAVSQRGYYVRPLSKHPTDAAKTFFGWLIDARARERDPRAQEIV